MDIQNLFTNTNRRKNIVIIPEETISKGYLSNKHYPNEFEREIFICKEINKLLLIIRFSIYLIRFVIS